MCEVKLLVNFTSWTRKGNVVVTDKKQTNEETNSRTYKVPNYFNPTQPNPFDAESSTKQARHNSAAATKLVKKITVKAMIAMRK